MKSIFAAGALLWIFWGAWPMQTYAEEIPGLTGILSLRQAVSETLLKNPGLAAFSSEIRAREARALQEGLIPNPRLIIKVEDATGTGQFGGFKQSQTTVFLSQLIELGGKRIARRKAAELSGKLAGWDYETQRMDVLTALSKRFTELVSIQEKVSLLKELLDLAEQTLQAVSNRVRAGKVSPLEKTPVTIARSNLQLQLQQTLQDLEVARQRLSSLWGDPEPKFKQAEGNLFTVYPLPKLEGLMRDLSNNPDLARWSKEILQRKAVVERERSKAIPNVTVQGAFRRIEDTSDNTLVFGIIVPLQLFNRNQGAIEEARHRLARTESAKQTAELQVKNTLAKAYAGLKKSYMEVFTIKTQILPEAEKAYESFQEGYRKGKFGYLDVLQSQKIYFNSKVGYLQALTQYHQSVADLERVVGKPLSTVGGIIVTHTEGKSGDEK